MIGILNKGVNMATVLLSIKPRYWMERKGMNIGK